jgi:photosystem II stability/assembly factor-like uncharacterized protein
MSPGHLLEIPMPRPLTLPTLAIIPALAAAVFACADRIAAGPDFALASRQSGGGPTVTPQETGTTFRFFAVSAVNDRVVWASAAGGTFARTTDGGATWVSRQVPGAEALQFRDVQGVSERVAYLMSAGSGPENRLYMTQDGGDTWVLQYQATDPRAFHDCFDFWTPKRALLFGDSFDDHFTLLKLKDGNTWQNISAHSPTAQPGEGGFAASGTCIKTLAGQSAWIGTGAAPQARVLATRDGGQTWSVSADVPIEPHGTPTSGVASIDFRDPFHGILGGGDVVASADPQLNVARSNDGGATWSLTTPTPFPGAVYGLSYVPGKKLTVVATGPGGSAWTADEGGTWTLLPGITNCWAVGFSVKTGWLGCGAGRIFRIDFSD